MKDIIKTIVEHPIATVIVAWAVSKNTLKIVRACEKAKTNITVTK